MNPQAAALDELFPTVAFEDVTTTLNAPWFIRDFWQRGKINVLFGPEKAGKSRLLSWLIVNALTKRENVLDLPIDWYPQNALYLAGEEQPGEVRGRLLRYSAFLGENPAKLALPMDFIAAPGMRLDLDRYRRWLEDKLVGGGYDFVVIDPLRRVHGADENDNSAMSVLFNDLRRWTNQKDITLVMLHHTGKLGDDANFDRIATWGRGATDLAAILDTAQFIQRRARTKVQVMRAGRFKSVDPLDLEDGEDDKFVFRLESKRK